MNMNTSNSDENPPNSLTSELEACLRFLYNQVNAAAPQPSSYISVDSSL